MTAKKPLPVLVSKSGSELIQHTIAYEYGKLPEIQAVSNRPALIVCEFDGAQAMAHATWYHACLLSKKMDAEDQLAVLDVLRTSCLGDWNDTADCDGRIDLLVVSYETLLGYCVAMSEFPLTVHWLCKPGLLGGMQWHQQTKINLYKQKPRPRTKKLLHNFH